MAPGMGPKHDVSVAGGWKPILAKLNRDVSLWWGQQEEEQQESEVASGVEGKINFGSFCFGSWVSALAATHHLHSRMEKIIVGLAAIKAARRRERLLSRHDLFTCTFHTSWAPASGCAAANVSKPPESVFVIQLSASRVRPCVGALIKAILSSIVFYGQVKADCCGGARVGCSRDKANSIFAFRE